MYLINPATLDVLESLSFLVWRHWVDINILVGKHFNLGVALYSL